MADVSLSFLAPLVSAGYVAGQTPTALDGTATGGFYEISYQWYRSDDRLNWSAIDGARDALYTPDTSQRGKTYYQVTATAVVEKGLYPSEDLYPADDLYPFDDGSETIVSNAALIEVTVAQTPIFLRQLAGAEYAYAALALPLDGTAIVPDAGQLTYQWQKSADGANFEDIYGAVGALFTPPTYLTGKMYYRVAATNTLVTTTATAYSNTANICVVDHRLTPFEKWALYLKTLRGAFLKLAKLEFLQPDGSVAFAIDNNPKNRRSSAFIHDGTLNVNLQNGQRRKASVTLWNLSGDYDYQINKIWFGQQIRLMMGLLLPNGDEYYFPQGVFYVSNPQEAFAPNSRTATYELVDKWAYLDGTLFGNLDTTYEVALGENIFDAISSVLKFDRGNGYPVDSAAPLFTNFYNGKTVTLTDGTTVPVTVTPYTYRCDSESGTYADIALEMNTMLAGWIGYDRTGRLRLDASDEDILDADKPALWDFSTSEVQFLGSTYSIKNTEVYNDIIVLGEALGNSPQPKGRATNTDPRSDTNIYGSIGRRTLRLSAAGYYADSQCQGLANWWLKRYTVLQKSVTIQSTQMFHLEENSVVSIRREDKPGAPVERHLVTGFSLPIGQTGQMTIHATSVNDYLAVVGS